MTENDRRVTKEKFAKGGLRMEGHLVARKVTTTGETLIEQQIDCCV